MSTIMEPLHRAKKAFYWLVGKLRAAFDDIDKLHADAIKSCEKQSAKATTSLTEDSWCKGFAAGMVHSKSLYDERVKRLFSRTMTVVAPPLETVEVAMKEEEQQDDTSNG